MLASAFPCHARASIRRGTILPMLAVTMIALVSFMALAIDVGMIAIAKTQTQHAADLAALTATRTVNGDSTNNYNQTAATTNAQTILGYNNVLGQSIQSSQLSLTYGSYDYDQTTQTFSANFPALNGSAATAVSATVSSASSQRAFSSVFGSSLFPNVSATAQAVHRPRDIALVMDLSGSMRMGTCLGYDFYTSSRTSNNPDTVYPTFGHYSSSSADMQGPTSNQTSGYDNYTISPSNTTTATSSYTLTYVNNFYQNDAYATSLVRAFDSYTSTDGGNTWSAPSGSATPQLPPSSYATTPGGDVPLYKSGSTTTYAQTVKDVINSTSRNPYWELDGYSGCDSGSFVSNDLSGSSNYSSDPFYGYTQGPGYYGKTFFLWPPDPRRHLTYSNGTIFQQFYKDFGYSSTDLSTSKTWQPLYGIYSSSSSTPGDRNWPWPNDGGTALSNYLTTKVYIPGGSRLLKTTDSQYQQIMRLYNWDYVVDSVGTTPCDWRQRFFGTTDNTKLFNSSTGKLNTPGSSTYTINYNEILRWISQTPSPFPAQLRAGRIVYYSAIPTSISGSWPSYGGTDQRFWVEFIDYVLGFRHTSSSSYQDISSMAGYGSDFKWSTVSRSSPPSSGTQYMTYTDTPARPLLRFWFGPLMLVDFLQNYNMDEYVSNYYFMQPGDSYEAPIYVAKQAYVAAIATMKNNHPNDWTCVVPYSWPRSSASGTGRFNCVRCPLGSNYDYATASLLFPFSTINADGSANQTEITPYDSDPATGTVPSSDFMDTPRADGNTCFAMALMHCYNQFAVTPVNDTTLRSFVGSSPITFPGGMAGGLGRKGAQKVIIFETDGLANTSATASLVSAGTYKYYKIRYDMNSPSRSEYPSVSASYINDPSVLSQIYSLVQQLATDYGSSRNPFRLYGVGFGPVFQGSDASAALQTLQSMQYYAGTQSSASTALASNQIITGTGTQMSSNMVSAFTSILQNGVQVALIK